MMRAARRNILLADTGKFGKVALHVFAPLTKFNLVITDTNLPDDTRQMLINDGVDLKQVMVE